MSLAHEGVFSNPLAGSLGFIQTLMCNTISTPIPLPPSFPPSLPCLSCPQLSLSLFLVGHMGPCNQAGMRNENLRSKNGRSGAIPYLSVPALEHVTKIPR